MASTPLRFLHAGDFHLEEFPSGITEAPDHLRDLLIDVPYRAAVNVFDAALREAVDFVVLAGDLLQPEITGPRGALFLHDQFQRLAARQIAVYWAAGEVDSPSLWPDWLELPPNVHVFSSSRVEELAHQRDGLTIARLRGIGRDGQRPVSLAAFEQEVSGPLTIAVVNGEFDAAAFEGSQINYWALGGRHERSTLLSSPGVAHYCGTPQGRQPHEGGSHGCTLVHVDGTGPIRTTLVPTDVLRWCHERVSIDQRSSRESLEAALRQRMRGLEETAPGTALLVAWTVAGHGPLLAHLRAGKVSAELLEWLRTEYGLASPPRWSVSLEAEPTAALPAAWYEEDSIRGDFLRAVRQYQAGGHEPLDLDAYLDPRHASGTLGAAVSVSDPAVRERVLREAALLGVDLLSGEETQS